MNQSKKRSGDGPGKIRECRTWATDLENKREVMTSKKPALQSEKEKVRDIGQWKADLHTKLQGSLFPISDGVKVGHTTSVNSSFFGREPEFDGISQYFLLKGVTIETGLWISTHFAGMKSGHPLDRSSMGKGIRNGRFWRILLKQVVPFWRGRVPSNFHITAPAMLNFEVSLTRLRQNNPPEVLPNWSDGDHADPFHGPILKSFCNAISSEHDVRSHGNHIGPAKSPMAPRVRVSSLKKLEIKIKTLIARTIKSTCRLSRRTARRWILLRK